MRGHRDTRVAQLSTRAEQLRRIGRETRFVGATIKEAHRDANKLGFFKGLFSGLRTTKSRKARNKAVSFVVGSASTSSASLAGKSAAGAADDTEAPPLSAFDGAPVRLERAMDDQREYQLADNLDDIEHTLRDLRAQALIISDTLERQNRTITDVTVRATLSVEDARHLNRRLGI